MPLTEAPAPRRHPAGDLDDLTHTALDEVVEDRVDNPVAGEKQPVQRRAAEQPAGGGRQARR